MWTVLWGWRGSAKDKSTRQKPQGLGSRVCPSGRSTRGSRGATAVLEPMVPQEGLSIQCPNRRRTWALYANLHLKRKERETGWLSIPKDTTPNIQHASNGFDVLPRQP